MGHHLLDVADISLDILQIPTEHHPRFSYSMGTLLDVCQISFPSLSIIFSTSSRAWFSSPASVG